ncbi:MAG TPA: 5-formyltetrahydrofolate cyclo-ligase [Stackebrandtia sp.]|jgi:5-formyltetrahydrofolate cyclo-ligase|uniref:5-formyltetrahydrofolate cyclo-ligase n=1 Tax=Stackebrandtia sp. TaxID=2023065 RepID=UPI002D584343|nr:5-formyltetrahydrofolate cyclo-ligase [Stackebrandtia sp.]HZE41096.1 5-formyltetrahydrofolate cyclo-ligase [Stackebrandtia sp.]
MDQSGRWQRESKARLRADILRERRQMSPVEVESATRRVHAALLAHLSGRDAITVAAYYPLKDEPGGHLPEALRAIGLRVLLPVLRADDDLEWAAFAGATTRTPRGLSEPDGPSLGLAAIAAVDVVVVPALAVAADGTRLGRGGGSYDRALARVSAATPVIAPLFDGEWPVEVPAAAHDRPVTAVCTPGAGVVSLVPLTTRM